MPTLELSLNDLTRTITTVARDDKLTEWTYAALDDNIREALFRSSADRCKDLEAFKGMLRLFKNPELSCVSAICAFAVVVHQQREIPIIDLCRTIADWLEDESSDDNDSRGEGTFEGGKSCCHGGPH